MSFPNEIVNDFGGLHDNLLSAKFLLSTECQLVTLANLAMHVKHNSLLRENKVGWSDLILITLKTVSVWQVVHLPILRGKVRFIL